MLFVMQHVLLTIPILCNIVVVIGPVGVMLLALPIMVVTSSSTDWFWNRPNAAPVLVTKVNEGAAVQVVPL